MIQWYDIREGAIKRHLLNKVVRVSLILLLPLGFSRDAIAQQPISSKILIPRGTYYLHGHFFEADSERPAPIVILLPGIPGGVGDVLSLGRRLSEEGIHTLTFNYSGTHHSGGEWTMANDKTDVRAANDYIHQHEIITRYGIDTTRVYLGGYSHGGGVALLYAADHSEVRRVFSIGGNDFGEWARKTTRDAAFRKVIDELFVAYAAQGLIRPANGADRELLDHVDKYDVRVRAPLLADRQILLVAGLDDQTTVMEDHMLPFYRALQREGTQDMRFISYKADHSFGNVHDQIANQLVDWMLVTSSYASPNIKELHRRYMEASIQYDLEPLRSMTSQDIVWQLGPRKLVGLEAALGPNAYDVGMKTELDYHDVIVKGDTVEFEVDERSDLIRAVGMEEVRHYVRFVFENGLLKKKEPWKKSLDAEEGARRRAPFIRWIREKHPEVVDQLAAKENKFIFSKENGVLMRKLANEWRRNEDAAESPVEEVLAVNERLRAAALTSDVAEFIELLSDDLVVSDPGNNIRYRDDLISLFSSGEVAYRSIEATIDYAGELGDLVVIIGTESTVLAAAPIGSQWKAGDKLIRRFTNIFRKEDGEWRLIIKQSTVFSVE